jgi:tetratricopeptide (TPR) repeat protein
MTRAIAIVLVLWSSAALAQPAGAQAEVLFRQARELMAAGKVSEACSAFEESQKLEPALSTLLNLASCREQLGQFATAWGLFLDAARQTRSATDTTGQKLHDVAQSRAQKLEPRVSRLTINVPTDSQVEGLEITRGDDRVASGLWNRALPVDGGTYTISARAPGANRWSTQVTVTAEHDSKTVEIPDLRNLPRDLAPRAPLVVPLAVGGGALALLGAGLGFELWAESRYDAAKSEMAIQSHRDSLYDAANTRRYVGEVLAVTGLAAGGVAVWLYLRDRSAERAAGASVAVVPTGTGLVLHGKF